MLRKALVLVVLVMGIVRSSTPREVTASNCYSECSASLQSCPTECGASPSDCWNGYLTCVDSCDRGVGPWLIC